MSAPVKVFWLEPTGNIRRSFRCYHHACPAGTDTAAYCDASLPLDDIPDEGKSYSPDDFPAERFPTHCDRCHQPFASPQRQIFTDTLYRRSDTGEIVTQRTAPPGAMWDAAWCKGDGGADHGYTGPDGISLCVRCPDGQDWMVDSEASNCDKKQRVPVPDKPGWTTFVRTHYCWCRHGDPRTGNVHVDKVGVTCGAGAGSIQTQRWHGFLHDGFLRE